MSEKLTEEVKIENYLYKTVSITVQIYCVHSTSDFDQSLIKFWVLIRNTLCY